MRKLHVKAVAYCLKPAFYGKINTQNDIRDRSTLYFRPIYSITVSLDYITYLKLASKHIETF